MLFNISNELCKALDKWTITYYYGGVCGICHVGWIYFFFFCLIPSGRVVYVQCHGSGPIFIYACIGYQVVCLGRWLERRNIGMCWHTWISLLYNIIFSVMVNGTILILWMFVVLWSKVNNYPFYCLFVSLVRGFWDGSCRAADGKKEIEVEIKVSCYN